MIDDTDVIYDHTQAGTLIRWVLGSLILGLALFALGAPDGSAIVLVVIAILVFTLAAFSSLTVKVSDRDVALSFGPGLIRKRFPLQDTVEAEVVRNRWYYGWGVKFIGKGWLYNVSGLDAVELRFRNGRRARIGTDEPVELLAAIESQLRQGGS